MSKRENQSLLQNTIWLYVLTGVKLVAPLVTLPYLTRVLSMGAYGTVSYVKAYCTYVQLLIDFGFILSATRQIVIAKGDLRRIGEIVGDTVIEKGFLSIVALAGTLVACNFVPILHESMFFTLLYFSSCVMTIGVLDFLYRGIEQMRYVAIPFLVTKVISVVLTFILVHDDADLLLIPALETLGNGAAALISISFLKRLNIKLRPTNFTKWVADLIDSFIYFISNFATTFLGALTTLVAGIMLSSEDVAIWSVCMMILSAAKAMYSPISNSLYPRMLQTKDIQLVNKICLALTPVLFLGCIAVMCFAEPVITVFAGAKYIQSAHILKLLIPAFIFSFYSMMYGWPVLGAIGKKSETTVTTIVAALFQVLLFGVLIGTNSFSLASLSICCGLSEGVLLLLRVIIIIRNRECFIKEHKKACDCL